MRRRTRKEPLIAASLSYTARLIVCPLCPNCVFDPLGYHCVTYTRGGDITTRHNTQDSQCGLQNFPASWSAHLEVGCGWGQDNSRTRPADILVTNWDCGTSAAFDITVASPLNSINMHVPGCFSKDSRAQKIYRK